MTAWGHTPTKSLGSPAALTGLHLSAPPCKSSRSPEMLQNQDKTGLNTFYWGWPQGLVLLFPLLLLVVAVLYQAQWCHLPPAEPHLQRNEFV